MNTEKRIFRTVSPKAAKLMLTSHITFSVGWLGAVAVFFALAIAGIYYSNTPEGLSAYMAMKISAWYVIVPFCFASLITGIAQAIFTQWGLFSHYWVVIKLVLTVAATILLLLHIQPIEYLSQNGSITANNSGVQIQVLADAGAALLLLIGITAISVYKPWGKIKKSANQAQSKPSTPIGYYLTIGLIVIIIIVIIKHLLGGGMGHH